jgi:hypothetical protein
MATIGHVQMNAGPTVPSEYAKTVKIPAVMHMHEIEIDNELNRPIDRSSWGS